MSPEIEYRDSDEEPKYAKVCLYGDFGTAKTVTAVSYSPNPILVYTDGSWTSIKNHGLKASLVSYDGVSQLMSLPVAEDTPTIILDTVNEMVEEYLDMLMRSASWGGKFRETLQIGKGASAGVNLELRGMENPAPADYQVIRNKFRPAIRRLMKAPIDLFINAHENSPIEGLSKDMTKRPALPDKVYKVIAQDCHVLGRTTRDSKGKFWIDVEGNSLVAAKSRISTIKGKMTPEDFIAALQEWKKN